MRRLYTLSMYLYELVIKIAACLGNSKARLWIQGRKEKWTSIGGKGKLLWMHVSSLGEFEQGRPVLEQIKQQYPTIRILLTFFSPSGYEVRKNYSLADKVMYLPLDVPKRVRAFLNYYAPDVAVFVKYDFWYNYLNELHERKIPIFFISVSLRPSQVFFKWYGVFFRKHLKKVTYFFAQREQTCKLLQAIGIKPCMVAGDTRFDRVITVAKQRKRWSVLDNFTRGHKVYVGGSTWLEDEKYIARALEWFSDVKFIVVPHEVNEARIAQIEALMPGKTIRYSLCNDEMLNFPQVLIVDQIGMLSSIYAYATVAHIGNGFGSGIHNTLEAAVYGVPVIFGPKYHKFPEAVELINLGAAFSFSNFEMYKRILEKLFYEDVQSIREKARHYVFSQAGATNKILKILENYLRE